MSIGNYFPKEYKFTGDGILKTLNWDDDCPLGEITHINITVMPRSEEYGEEFKNPIYILPRRILGKYFSTGDNILVVGCETLEEATEVAERIRAAISEKVPCSVKVYANTNGTGCADMFAMAMIMDKDLVKKVDQ